jgi:RNA-splicing ligase RtcB
MKDIGYRDANVFIDEIPMAYKDIDVVMDDAAGQVGFCPHSGMRT